MKAAIRPSGSASRRRSREERSRQGGGAHPFTGPARSGGKSASVASLSPAATTWPCRSAIATSSAGTGPVSTGRALISPPLPGSLRRRGAGGPGEVTDGVLDVGPVVPEAQQAAAPGQRVVLRVDGDRGDPEPAFPQ